jgi:ABC-type transport system involved in multi-copper enzyme maturation permease subunit
VVTYRWQRRLAGSLVCSCLSILSSALFSTYGHKPASYFVYGVLTLLFIVLASGSLISGIYHLIKNISGNPKTLGVKDDGNI